MTDRELMRMALDALEKLNKDGWILADFENEVYASIEALRARLAQPEPEPYPDDFVDALKYHTAISEQPEPEPVAWVAYENGEKHGIDFDEDDIAKLPVGTMLYTAPPQREWQDLTDDESDEIWGECLGVFDCLKMTQAKLKEKNT